MLVVDQLIKFQEISRKNKYLPFILAYPLIIYFIRSSDAIHNREYVVVDRVDINSSWKW